MIAVDYRFFYYLYIFLHYKYLYLSIATLTTSVCFYIIQNLEYII